MPFLIMVDTNTSSLPGTSTLIRNSILSPVQTLSSPLPRTLTSAPTGMQSLAPRSPTILQRSSDDTFSAFENKGDGAMTPPQGVPGDIRVRE
ncbi:hypothetical protein BC936DRAFT_142010 [Jimgerdemannia flammicorona]|uniref:Uncharacterized protein n=1 Tax=Jimgerdemannia flammicorona TaxID=994334 RepID=A0A433DFQ4_9FUNG|nr:hypothetical protein BC936DRAFT_142010 [Jimgerdemannia flammicorona]